MRYLTLLILLLPLLIPSAVHAQTPPAELGLFDTWVPVQADSVGTGIRLVYRAAAVPADSAEVAYGQSGNAAAWRAIVGGEVWAKTLTGGTFRVTEDVLLMEYYLTLNPDEWTRLQALMQDRQLLGFARFFGVGQ